MSHLGIRWIAIGTMVLVVGACDQTSIPGPSPQERAAGTRPLELRVVDGWSNAAVASALVSAIGSERATDAAGRVTVDVHTGACSGIAVRAAGFLERRTCSFAELIPLWPVADEAETAATHAAAFPGDWLMVWPGPGYVGLIDLADRQDVQEVWRKAGERIRGVTNGRLSISIELDNVWSDAVIRRASSSERCMVPSPWPLDVAGFCPNSDGYSMDVTEAGLIDPEVATRTIAFALLLKPHDLPGFLNRRQPGRDFSDFERKVLHMIGLRQQAVAVAWPDFDVGWWR